MGGELGCEVVRGWGVEGGVKWSGGPSGGGGGGGVGV